VRPIAEQVVVITGASSGIGRETALQFAERGASVVVAARNEEALRTLEREVTRLGGHAHVAVTDVAQWDQVQRLADEAVAHFGRIDTWVNNAAVSEYATVEQMSTAEIDRIIQVILLGEIYGMKAALPHLIGAGEGSIINVASVLAKASVPLQAAYCAAKHGIAGFTATLRQELARDHPGIAVTLILPASINTPLFTHARSKLGVMPRPLPPIYEPGTVAHAIVYAAEHPRREIVVGGAGKLLLLLQRLSPALVDWLMVSGGRGFTEQRTNRPDDGRDNLFAPMTGTGRVAGAFGAHSQTISVYTRYVALQPPAVRIAAGTACAGMAGAALLLAAAVARRIVA
jgi:NAD(P)-dependent dehydrogenase (short-subunit alcohol dehydrogenase family)